MPVRFFRRRQQEQDLDEELRAHFGIEVRQLIERGFSPDEAEAQARRSFGNLSLVRKVTRASWGYTWLESLWQDLHYAFRMLRKTPGFTAAVLLTLALCIGVNTAVFTLVNALLLTPLPYRDPGQLVRINSSDMFKFFDSAAAFNAWKKQSSLLQDAALDLIGQATILGGGEPMRVRIDVTTANLPKLLGEKPLMGRLFLPDDDEAKGGASALLSEELWRQRFGSDTGVLGRQISLNGSKFTIVGVLSALTAYPRGTQVWLSGIRNEKALDGLSGSFDDGILARMKPGVTKAQANAQQTALARAEKKPDSFGVNGVRIPFTWRVSSLHGQLAAPVRTSALLLFGAVLLVLLIGCVNVANLVMARSVSRQPEFAMRRVLGVSTARLVRQLLTEHLLLGLGGGLLGLLFAVWGVSATAAVLPDNWPHYAAMNVDARVLAFTLAVAVLAGLVAGVGPSLYFARSGTEEAFKQGARATGTVKQRRWAHLLVTAETALAMALLVGAALLTTVLLKLENFDPGFRPQKLLTLTVSQPKDDKSAAAFFQRVLTNLRTLRGATAVGATDQLPFRIPGVSLVQVTPPGQKDTTAYNKISTPGYLGAMGIPLLSGRDFNGYDRGGQHSVIVNDVLARKLWPGQDPIGRTLTVRHDTPVTATVIGVAAASRMFQVNESAQAEIYEDFTQRIPRTLTFVLRAKQEGAGLAKEARQAIHQADSREPVDEERWMENYLSHSLQRPRTLAILLSVFSGLGLLLALLGVYSLISYSVTQRTREFGIRVALGAHPFSLLAKAAGEGLGFVVPGILVGAFAALGLNRLLSSELYGVTVSTPELLGALTAGLVAVGALASGLAARRAATVDPVAAIRHE
jgi:predicted permease